MLPFHNWPFRVQGLGDDVLGALRTSAYAVIGRAGPNQEFLTSCLWNRWLNQLKAIGDDMPNTSRAPMIAHWKAGELLARHPVITDEEVRCTPVFNEPEMHGTGWRGGVQVGERIIAISGQPQHHDQLIAALMHTAASPDLDPQLIDTRLEGSTRPVLEFRTPKPEEFLAFIAGVCGVGVKVFYNTPEIQNGLWVDREVDDQRGYPAIGVTAKS